MLDPRSLGVVADFSRHGVGREGRRFTARPQRRNGLHAIGQHDHHFLKVIIRKRPRMIERPLGREHVEADLRGERDVRQPGRPHLLNRIDECREVVREIAHLQIAGIVGFARRAVRIGLRPTARRHCDERRLIGRRVGIVAVQAGTSTASGSRPPEACRGCRCLACPHRRIARTVRCRSSSGRRDRAPPSR